MSISLGGMGIISLRNPFADLVFGKGDLRSMFCLIVFLIVFFILGSFSAISSLLFSRSLYRSSLFDKPNREFFSFIPH